MNSAIIVAAGSSQRMGFDKLMAPLCGLPVAAHSLDRFERSNSVDEVILVVRSERQTEFEQIIYDQKFRKVSRIVAGGKERHFSVSNGLEALSPATRLVAVHDAARPLVSPRAIDAAFALAAEKGAVSLAAPVVDTLKRADKAHQVLESVDRIDLWGMQTPQVFRLDWLRAAYQQVIDSGRSVTDEVSALQDAGFPVLLIPNDDWNIKITFPRDLELAEKLIKLGEQAIRSSGS
jgi:2-C-methyl-D-erythritol 4-phosphate cytidylyltransferase